MSGKNDGMAKLKDYR